MKIKDNSTTDELLQRCLNVMSKQITRFEDQVESDAMESKDVQNLVAITKALNEVQRQIRQSLKDANVKDMSDEQLKRELEEYLSEKSKGAGKA